MSGAMTRIGYIMLLFAVALSHGVSIRAQNPTATPVTRTPPTPTAAPPRDPVKVERNAAEAAEIKDDVAEALAIIEKYYIDRARLNYNDLFKSSIAGMLRSLDPHSEYYDAKDFAQMQADYSSQYFGIGATIGSRRIGNDLDTFVLATFENSPAVRAGLRYGDKILAIDDWDADNRASVEVRDKLRGPRGTPVRVTFERARDGQRQTVSIVRDAVPQPTVPDAYMIRPGVGYIDFTRAFHRTTADEFKAAVNSLRQQGMTSLILDLRGNGGGLLEQAVKVAGTFVPAGQLVVSQAGRAIKRREYRSSDPLHERAPLVVLVNRSTASAAEILAGALQDHDRALLVGETTFGKGLVQSVIPLEYGTAVALTTSKYYTPSGRVVQRYYNPDDKYDYIFSGGLGRTEETPSRTTPVGREHRTGLGRIVYDGLGIVPDYPMKPRLVTPSQQRLQDPIFEFARELINGRVAGFESFNRQAPITFGHHLRPDEFVVKDDLFRSFKQFVAQKYPGKFTQKQLDADREFAARQLRFEVTTAAYGVTTAAMVFIADDPQLLRALDALPLAAELAATSKPRN